MHQTVNLAPNILCNNFLDPCGGLYVQKKKNALIRGEQLFQNTLSKWKHIDYKLTALISKRDTKGIYYIHPLKPIVTYLQFHPQE